MQKRKICVVITARPSYSRIKTALNAIKDHPKLELKLVLTSSALVEQYGSVFELIEKDGFDVCAKIHNSVGGSSITASSKTTGFGIIELSTLFDNLKPDIVVTIADRYETMATAIAASYMNIPLAHIQGGEITGNIDEKVRHSITKLSDYHFVASEEAKIRVINLGETPDYVFNTGCPSIDIAKNVLHSPELDFDPIKKYGGLGPNIDYKGDYLVVLQHPVTTDFESSRFQIDCTLNAINQTQIPTFWFWPNVDTGSDNTSKGIRIFRESNPEAPIHFFKNMESDDFLKLLINSKGLIGNSSVGIRECSTLGVPVVNIGNRQIGRTRGNNVIDVNHNVDEILSAIKNLNKLVIEPSNIYGTGNAGIKIANILSEVPLLFQKKITY